MESTQSDTQQSGTGVGGGQTPKTIADYVGDMLSLESHIEEALDRQLGEVKDYQPAHAAVQQFHDLVKENREALKAHQSQAGMTAGGPIKKVGSAVLGMAAGVIDNLRTEGISKSLRDDYTAFNLAAVGYEMLHTTSMALGDRQTAELAERGLRNHARMIQQINHLMPDVVLHELAKDGHPVQAGVAQQCRQTFDRIWKETAQSNGQAPFSG